MTPKNARTGVAPYKVSTPPGLEVREVPGKGRGVFATQFFKRGAVVEDCPTVIVPAEEIRTTDVLGNYIWGEGMKKVVCLGIGSLYNHSYEPNLVTHLDMDERILRFEAFRDIYPGDELTHNYPGDPESRVPMWFKTAEDKAPKVKKKRPKPKKTAKDTFTTLQQTIDKLRGKKGKNG